MQQSTRFIEIDIARVSAIGLMILYHLAFDLQTYYGIDMELYGKGWILLERTCASMFLFLTGLCFGISWQRRPDYKKFLRRGAGILLYACVVTIVTYLFDASTYVRFGILHLIATSSILLPLLAPLRFSQAVIGVLIIVIGVYGIGNAPVDTPLLLPFGWTPEGFRSVDYFPVIPWMGIILIGAAMTRRYKTWRKKFWPQKNETNASTMIESVSRRSLLIYMLHQPILLLILWLWLGRGAGNATS